MSYRKCWKRMWILFQTIEPVFWGVTAVFQPGMGVEVAGGGGFGALLVLRKRVPSKERHRERQTSGEGQCAGEGSIWLVPFIFRNCQNLAVTLFIILLCRIRAPVPRKLCSNISFFSLQDQGWHFSKHLPGRNSPVSVQVVPFPAVGWTPMA